MVEATTATFDHITKLLVDSMPSRQRRQHVPLRAWQERHGEREITWLCSCGCINKHVLLPADLRCVDDKEDA